MKKNGVMVLGFLAGIAATAAPVAEQVNQVLEQTEARQEQMLRGMLRKPFPASGMWYFENFAMAAYGLNQRTEEADAGILTLREGLFPGALEEFDAGSLHWHIYLQERLYWLYSSRSKHHPGRMSGEAENAILEMLWEWASPVCAKELADPEKIWLAWGSENHHLMAWASFWGAAQIFEEHPDYKDRTYADGSTPTEMAAAFDDYFKTYARERATKGLLVEVAAPTYVKYSLNTWYNLVDFADDPVLKELMDKLLNVYWADWAVEQLDGVRGGSRHRCYAGRASTEQSGGGEAAWYHFGLGVEASQHPGTICAATTFWRPDPVVVELALDPDARGEYSFASRRPGVKASLDIVNWDVDESNPIYSESGVNNMHPQGGSLLRTTWCTPDFVAGMSQVPPLPQDHWTGISGQNRWNGIIFDGHDTARIFTQPDLPKKGSVYNAEWGVQYKGVMILQRLRASNAVGQRIWFDGSLKRVETNDWVFVEAPQAYAAVRIGRDSGVWQADSKAQRREGKGRDGLGEWLVLNNEYSPVIMEAARKKDYASFEAFQSAILANKVLWRGRILTYRSAFYDTTLTLPVMADSLPLIDGKPIELEPSAVYDSPYLKGEFGSGIVTIQKGDQKVTYDFNHDKIKPMKSLKPITCSKTFAKAAADIAAEAGKLVVTTRDRGDGTPGKGGDGWVSETNRGSLKSKPGTGKFSVGLMTRCPGNKQDIVYMRWDLIELQGDKVQDAELKLYFKGTDTESIKVYGLKDGVAGVNRRGTEDVNDHDADQHDEFWKESLLDRESAPGMLKADGDPATIEWDEEAIVYLGTFRNPGTPESVGFKSAEMTNFINNDSNGVVTIMLQGRSRSSTYASKDCPENLPAPALELFAE